MTGAPFLRHAPNYAIRIFVISLLDRFRIKLPRLGARANAPAAVSLPQPVPMTGNGRDAPVEAEEACATARGKLVAIGAIEAGMFKPKRVFAA